MLIYPLMWQMAVPAIVLPLVYQPVSMQDSGLSALMTTSSFAGCFMIVAAYRCAPGIVVAPMQYSQIIWAAIIGALLFNEQPSARVWIGMAVIMLAGLVIVTRRVRAVEIARMQSWLVLELRPAQAHKGRVFDTANSRIPACPP